MAECKPLSHPQRTALSQTLRKTLPRPQIKNLSQRQNLFSVHELGPIYLGGPGGFRVLSKARKWQQQTIKWELVLQLPQLREKAS